MLPPFSYVLATMYAAGLTSTEMIALLPVARGTFYNWKRGQVISDLLRYRLTIARCKAVEEATRQGRLPLKLEVPKSMRAKMIDNILVDVRRSG